MTKENNKVDINKHEMDIDTLKKQNVNDLLSLKELYSKLEELGEKITKIKYIDNTLVKKLKKEYENLNKIILDENIQVQLDNKIDDFNLKLTHDIETINEKLTNDIEPINEKLTNDIESINSQIGYMKNISYREVTPEMFGAKGDGVTDDTQAIKNAISNVKNSGGKVLIKNKYKITSSLTIPKGVSLIGLGDGLFVDNSILYAEIANGSPVINFDETTTGIKLKDFKIINTTSSLKKFVGIDITSCEYTTIENVTVKGAKIGINLTSQLRPIYLLSLKHVSTINGDIGINITSTGNWKTGISIEPKDISDNRIGFNIDGGQGCILGGKSEIGRNSEIGIKINDGNWELSKQLWIEDSPIGIQINNGNVIFNGDIYCLNEIEVLGGKLTQNGTQFLNNYTTKKISFKNLSWWFSFDKEENQMINYKDGVVFPNTYTTECNENGIYGHCGFLQKWFGNNLLKNYINLSQDWTMMFLVKYISESNMYRFLSFENNDKTESNTFYIAKDKGSTISNYNKEGWVFNLGCENNLTKKFGWIILQYNSTNKKIYSLTSSGLQIISNGVQNLDLTNYDQGQGLTLYGENNIVYDECIAYNRLLTNDEINAISSMNTVPQDLKINLIINKIGGLL